MLVQTALAQFPDADVDVVIVANVVNKRQLEIAVTRARKREATIVHTLVDGEMRRELVHLARTESVPQIDLMGRLMRRLSSLLRRKPIGQPGRYRCLHEAYFDRVEAIEFAVLHDDGQHLDDLAQSDIVLVGVSRAGKTPLSMYLSVQGWKVANIPFVGGIPLPDELKTVDRCRVVGLLINPNRLRIFRSNRGQRMGLAEDTDYTSARAIREEVEASARVFRSRGYTTLDVTEKPIEETAEDVVTMITRRLRG
jgi:hypothetical protein